MNKPLWISETVDQILGAKSSKPWQATGVSIDSRTLHKGDLFVPIAGDHMDGHTFIHQAEEAGASACLTHQEPHVTKLPFVKVQDTLKALEKLGVAARDRTSAKVIAVTGSVGKTSTKEALFMAFSALGRTSASQGGLNNHWGLPLSLARIPEDNDFAVLEMGMNHPDELRPLTKMARPHVAIITTVADVHRAFFKSTEEIALAKAEIFDGVEPGGTLIINRDTPTYPTLLSEAKKNDQHHVLTFGAHIDSDVRMMSIMMNQKSCTVHAEIKGQSIEYSLNTTAQHLAFNSLSVLGAVHALGGDLQKAAQALSQFTPLSGRGNQTTIRLNGGSFLLIDESYNASPIAVKAALSVLGSTPKHEHGRRIFVFGDMGELGEDAQRIHVELAPLIENEKVDLFFSCGQISEALFKAIPETKRGQHTTSSEDLARIITSQISVGDIVMVKGSRSMKMERVVKALMELQHAL